MSEAHPSQQPTPPAPPGYPPGYFPPRQQRSGLGCFLALSLLLNLVAVTAVVIGCIGVSLGWGVSGSRAVGELTERRYGGEASAENKVAIVRVNGVIMEGAIDYSVKQIDQAARDKQVKAVVLRINSPGGSITASDDLWRRLRDLRDGDPVKKYDAKPLVVSMASMATSGGYYIAMPGQHLFAERTTLTGSIGVYAAFPSLDRLGEKIGVGMNVIKQGDIKDSGSPFKEMEPKERAIWQSMVNQAYKQFTDVVKEGRTRDGKLLLGHPLHERFPYSPVQVPGAEGPEKADLTRYLADGGIWTAPEALEHRLIDAIGTLDDAVVKARSLASLGDDTLVIRYEEPKTLSQALFGLSPPSRPLLDVSLLRQGLTPRLWYLAPGSELAGLLAACEEGKGTEE